MKQVIRFGGKILVASDPAQKRGTIFTFDLPALLIDDPLVTESALPPASEFTALS